MKTKWTYKLFILKCLFSASLGAYITTYGDFTENSKLTIACYLDSVLDKGTWSNDNVNPITICFPAYCTDPQPAQNINIYANVSAMFVFINPLTSNVNLHWYCANGEEKAYVSIYILIPLQHANLVPNGTVTLKQGASILFICSAKSYPQSVLSWTIDNAPPTTSRPRLSSESGNVVFSNLTYIAQKSDNEKKLICTANNNKTSVSTEALLDIQFKPTVTILPDISIYNVIENNTLQLTCNGIDSNPPPSSYTWYKDNQFVTVNATYTLFEVKRSHNGSYRCNASNTVGTSLMSVAVTVNVLYGVTIVPISRQQQVEGTNLSIMCYGQSNPPVTDDDVVWTKQDNNTFTWPGRQLLIKNLDRHDSGFYICTINKTFIPSYGTGITRTANTTAEVEVLYRPTVTITPDYNPYNIIENTTNVQLVCNVKEANPPALSYRWLKNNSVISANQIYTILHVNRADTGNYTCEANNTVGYSKASSPVFVVVLYGIELTMIDKQSPTEEDQLSVNCSGQSNPAITDTHVRWSKIGNITFGETGRTLLIKKTNRLDSGIFICSVTITMKPSVGDLYVATATTTVTIDVLYRPTVEIDSISSDKYKYSVVENSTNIVLTCKVKESNPPAFSYVWYKDSSTFSVNETANYTMMKVSRSDTGNYICKAINLAGISDPSLALQLNVLYGVVLDFISNKEIIEGTQLNVTCSGQSNPVISDQHVSWTKQNNKTFLLTGSNLVISKVQRQDIGIFVCTVTITLIPSTGKTVSVTGTTTVDVNVLFRPSVAVIPSTSPYNVTENDTNVQLTCDVIESNPNVSSYKWYKGDFYLFNKSMYTIDLVKRNDAGRYSCSANNTVGSSTNSSALELNVLYGVALTIDVTDMSVTEGNKLNLSCDAIGNPTPVLTWKYYYNDSVIANKTVVAYTYKMEITNANCQDTGKYICFGHNKVRNDSKSVNVKVACSPRNSKNTTSEDVFIKGRNGTLHITAIFISYPPPVISWLHQPRDSNITQIGPEFNISSSTSLYPYEYLSSLQKDSLLFDEFGDYIVKASNIYGSFTLTYHVKPKRIPDKPTILSVQCLLPGESTIIWKGGFNGGQSQHFELSYSVTTTENPKMHESIVNDTNLSMYTLTLKGLQEGFLHYFSVYAVNSEGRNGTDEPQTCTVMGSPNTEVSGALIGGISGSVIGVVVIVILVFIVRKRHWITKKDKENEVLADSNRINSCDEENDEGLVDNILYISAEGILPSNASDNEYAEVKKAKTKFIENYAEVKKSNVNSTRLDVYENIEMPFSVQPKSVKEKLADDRTQCTKGNINQHHKEIRNNDGLLYADLIFNPALKGAKYVIHGLEDKTIYAEVDTTQKIDPLPESDNEDVCDVI